MTDTVKSKRARRFARTPNTGANAIGEAPPQVEPAAPKPIPKPAAKPESKAAHIVALMQREEGASLEEMVAETGWLPHTTRAMLTGLRKKGHAVQRAVIGGTSRYTIAGAA